MDTASNPLRSPWLVRDERGAHAALAEDLEVDVAVLGGGIVGVAAAHYLAEAGRSVALLEARTVGSGVTGNSTAKLTALPGSQYSQITSKHGTEPARAYAKLNRAGVEAAFALAEEHSVECRLERRPAFTYAEDESNASTVEDEADAAR
jgi:glycine/D-amino acid oxidase-like deaminating enzyme